MNRERTQCLVRAAVTVLLVAVSALRADGAGAPTLRVSRLARPPVIDGSLAPGEWDGAAVASGFVETSPGDNTPPPWQTSVLVGFDDRALYVAFRASDEPGRVRASLARRDDIESDDTVGIYLDTFADRRQAYKLTFNPLGVQADSLYTEGGQEDPGVDVVMESRGMLTDSGYVVEVAIPFESLRYHSGPGLLWGVHFVRTIRRLNDERSSWAPIGRDLSSLLGQEGYLAGIEGIPTTHTLELIPSVVAARDTVPDGSSDAEPASGRTNGLDVGVNVRLRLTPSLDLEAAINPDFAQVEADELVSVANRRFPVFFEERRPFFLVGAEIFKTPLETFHSRAIVDPDVALKLSGRLGRTTLGLLAARDGAPGNVERGAVAPDGIAGRAASVLVARVQRDIGEESKVGLLATAYSFPGERNVTIGADGRLRLGAQTVFGFQAVATGSHGLFYDPALDLDVARVGHGLGYSYVLDHETRHLSLDLEGTGRSTDYRADVGFTPRTNFNSHTLFAQYRSEPRSDAAFVSWSLSNEADVGFDWQARLHDWDETVRATASFSRSSYLALAARRGYARLFEEEFGPIRAEGRAGAFAGAPERSAYASSLAVDGGTTPWQAITLFGYASVSRGSFDYDFGAPPRYPRVSPAALADPSAPLDPGPGRAFDAGLSAALQISDRLGASLGVDRSRLVREETGLPAFDETVLSGRATFHLTRSTYVRARVDYDTLASALQQQVLIAWTPGPGTAVYAGFNESLVSSPRPGAEGFGLKPDSRVFFVKVTYLIRAHLHRP